MPSAFTAHQQAERVTQRSSLHGDKIYQHQVMQKSSATDRPHWLSLEGERVAGCGVTEVTWSWEHFQKQCYQTRGWEPGQLRVFSSRLQMQSGIGMETNLSSEIPRHFPFWKVRFSLLNHFIPMVVSSYSGLTHFTQSYEVIFEQVTNSD